MNGGHRAPFGSHTPSPLRCLWALPASVHPRDSRLQRPNPQHQRCLPVLQFWIQSERKLFLPGTTRHGRPSSQYKLPVLITGWAARSDTMATMRLLTIVAFAEVLRHPKDLIENIFQDLLCVC